MIRRIFKMTTIVIKTKDLDTMFTTDIINRCVIDVNINKLIPVELKNYNKNSFLVRVESLNHPFVG